MSDEELGEIKTRSGSIEIVEIKRFIYDYGSIILIVFLLIIMFCMNLYTRMAKKSDLMSVIDEN